MSAKPRCDEITCFQNKTGKLCDLLTKHQSKPCPFFKTQEQVDTERLEAHEKT